MRADCASSQSFAIRQATRAACSGVCLDFGISGSRAIAPSTPAVLTGPENALLADARRAIERAQESVVVAQVGARLFKVQMILKLHDAGSTVREIAEAFDLPKSDVHREIKLGRREVIGPSDADQDAVATSVTAMWSQSEH